MSFKGEIRASLGWNWNDGAVDNDRLEYAELLLSGNGDNQAEAVWHETSQLLLSGASATLDLTDLTRSVLGDAHSVTFLTVKAVMIVSESASAGELLVGSAASDEWSEPFGADGDQIAVAQDSPLLMANRKNGWDVDASNKNLKLAAVGGDVTYSIAVIGTVTATQSGSGSS